MKNLRLPILAVAALGFTAFSVIRTHPTITATEPPGTPPVSPFAERVAAIGLVEANTENISLGAHLSGVVDEVLVKAGARVERGAPLVRLDTRHLQAALQRARAEIADRRASEETARARVGVAAARAHEAEDLLRIVRDAGSRSVAAEEIARRTRAVESTTAELAAARAQVTAATASINAAEAAARQVETDIERSTVTAPVAATVLQVNVRPGEFITAGDLGRSWLLLGNVDPLHVRVDVDEHEAWRVQPGAPAEGQVRGNSRLRGTLKFVRFEPYIIPKRSLTGDAAERVDTRVLQVIYRVDETDAPLFVGQQMDVFIAASAAHSKPTRTAAR